ncbi:hypothetical protein WMY93_015087 [Mugilogobius chulae]|uniref:C-type lectin domain-containing protein n=1 Tax=Mugilogobius chulae TaxID=88201 RepID=A0AAW0P137_9GOBI
MRQKEPIDKAETSTRRGRQTPTSTSAQTLESTCSKSDCDPGLRLFLFSDEDGADFVALCAAESDVFSVSQDHVYHFINEEKSWAEAQTFCRKYYTDLATVNHMRDLERLRAAAGDKQTCGSDCIKPVTNCRQEVALVSA